MTGLSLLCTSTVCVEHKKKNVSLIKNSFICFSAHNNKVNISNISILARGGGGNDRTVFLPAPPAYLHVNHYAINEKKQQLKYTKSDNMTHCKPSQPFQSGEEAERVEKEGVGQKKLN